MKFQRVLHLGFVTAWHSSSGLQPNFVALSRGRRLYSARRPSRWASAHILVIIRSTRITLECGPMPSVMAALPNIGGALCSTTQSLADAHYQSACSNAAKTRKLLKFAGVPQTPEMISATSGPKFVILWGHMDEIAV